MIDDIFHVVLGLVLIVFGIGMIKAKAPQKGYKRILIFIGFSSIITGAISIVSAFYYLCNPV
jgi:uncharacterized membrane protein HdeD (DUF308 family)